MRTEASDWPNCLVVTADGVLLGRVSAKALVGDLNQLVDDVLSEGPTTVRPSEPLPELLDRMRHYDVQEMAVTSPDGVLRGVLRRDGAEQWLADQAQE